MSAILFESAAPDFVAAVLAAAIFVSTLSVASVIRGVWDAVRRRTA